MLLLDSLVNFALNVEEVCGLDRSRVSNAVAFRKFAGGMRLEKDFLLNDRWANLPQVTSPVAMYGVIMHEMLPVSYDAAWLEGLGGHFSIRISGIGDYTLIALNRRVVTLSGLPVDHDSNAETIDLEIAPEVLQAYCRGLLLDIADEVLDAEDEFEDREISGAELLLNGMPSGGYSTVEMSSDFGSTLAAAKAGTIGTVGENSAAYAVIGTAGDQDWFAVSLVAGRTYKIELRGAASGRGTAKDLYLRAVFDANGKAVSNVQSNASAVPAEDAAFKFKPTKTGIYYIAAGAERSNTGSYEVSLTDVNLPIKLLPGIEMGGDFGNTIAAARLQSIGAVNVNGTAVGTIDRKGDKDWYAVTLEAGRAYRIDLRGTGSARGTLADPNLHAVYDANGTRVNFGNDNSFNADARIDLTVKTTGVYYIEAGGKGQGTYQLTVADTASGAIMLTSTEQGGDFGSTLAAAKAWAIGGVNVNDVAQGSISKSGDKDWFAVTLDKGTTYTIDLRGASSGRGTLADPVFNGIYDANGKQVSKGGTDNAYGLDARITFKPTSTGVYYIDAGGKATGTYQLSVMDAPDRFILPSVEYMSDFGNTLAAARGAAIGGVSVNGKAIGTITNKDEDWYAVTLEKGIAYDINMRGAASNRGTLPDPWIERIYDADGKVVNTGNDNANGKLDAYVKFTPTKSGTYYINAKGKFTQSGTYELTVTNPKVTGVNGTYASHCGVDVAMCGVKSSDVGSYYGNTGAGACGQDTVRVGNAVCGTDTGACGARIIDVKNSACGFDAGACGENATIVAHSACVAAIGVCGAKHIAINAFACGIDAAVCGFNSLTIGVGACGTAAYANGLRVGALGIYACGVDIGACGTRFFIYGAAVCGSDTSVCGIRASLMPCAGYGVACGVDLSFGADAGACVINALPATPSC